MSNLKQLKKRAEALEFWLLPTPHFKYIKYVLSYDYYGFDENDHSYSIDCLSLEEIEKCIIALENERKEREIIDTIMEKNRAASNWDHENWGKRGI